MIPAEKNLFQFILAGLAAGLLLFGLATSACTAATNASGYSPQQDQEKSDDQPNAVAESNSEQEGEQGAGVDRKKRMVLVGAVCIAVIGTVLILFGYFRMDHATRGFYSGRLQTLALFLMMVLVGFVVWFAQRFGF